MTPRGYLHPEYVRSLGELGTPRRLPRSGGSCLVRPIRNTGEVDAMGPYPLLCCQDWGSLALDLKEIGDEWVSFTCVADPFGDHTPELLAETFPALTRRYKDHWIADLELNPGDYLTKHHRYYARRALRDIEVVETANPPDHLDDWKRLYDHLVKRHQISGLRAFCREAFERQLALPGTVLFIARHEERTVGAHVWYLQGEHGYSHLAAFDDAGYELGASYALYRTAIDRLADRVRYLDFGAGAGLSQDSEDGLSRFKRGWASETRPVWLCGRVFSPEKYRTLSDRTGGRGGYFPAYRSPDAS